MLEQIERQISQVKEEAFSRIEILENVEKWLSACDEESWLEEYSRVSFFFLLLIVLSYLCFSKLHQVLMLIINKQCMVYLYGWIGGEIQCLCY